MGKRKLEKAKRAELRLCSEEIVALKGELTDAYRRFNNAADIDTVDACVFEIGALRSRYNTAIKHYRERYYIE